MVVGKRERQSLGADIAQDTMPGLAAEPAMGGWGQPPENIPGRQFSLHNQLRLSWPH